MNDITIIPQKQPTKTTCGETCVSMVTGVNLGVVRSLFPKTEDGPRKGTWPHEVVEVLQKLGWTTGEWTAVGGGVLPLPRLCLVRVSWHRRSRKSPTGYGTGYSRSWHWVVYQDGKFIDPVFGVRDGYGVRGSVTHYVAVTKTP